MLRSRSKKARLWCVSGRPFSANGLERNRHRWIEQSLVRRRTDSSRGELDAKNNAPMAPDLTSPAERPIHRGRKIALKIDIVVGCAPHASGADKHSANRK